MNTEILNKVFSSSEKKEYLKLHKKIMRNHMFVEMDFSNPDHVRLNKLTGKIAEYFSKFRKIEVV